MATERPVDPCWYMRRLADYLATGASSNGVYDLAMPQDRSGRVTHLLDEIQAGRTQATEELLPLVYAELRRMARARLAREHSGDVPQPTSLVHEAYLRLVGDEEFQWDSRAHFFAAAGEAMRRILIERARRRGRLKRGGGLRRVTLEEEIARQEPPSETLLALDEALDRLETLDPSMSNVVKLRYFAGLTLKETSDALNLPERTVSRLWTGARAWLHDEIAADSDAPPDATVEA